MTFKQRDALRRIENLARARKSRATYRAERSLARAPAYAAAVLAQLDEELGRMRAMWLTIRELDRFERPLAVINGYRREAPIFGQNMTVDEEHHRLDTVRENHKLLTHGSPHPKKIVLPKGRWAWPKIHWDPDDNMQDYSVSVLQEALDAYYEDPENMFEALRQAWHDAMHEGIDQHLLFGGRARMVDVRQEYDNHGAWVDVIEIDDSHSNEHQPGLDDSEADIARHDERGWEAGPDSVYKQRKLRSHVVPMDLDIGRNMLSLTDGQRAEEIALRGAVHDETVSALIAAHWQSVTDDTYSGTVADMTIAERYYTLPNGAGQPRPDVVRHQDAFGHLITLAAGQAPPGRFHDLRTRALNIRWGQLI